MGPATTRPAGPVPTALDYTGSNKLKAHVVLEGSQGVGRESGYGKGVGVLGGSQGVGREQGCWKGVRVWEGSRGVGRESGCGKGVGGVETFFTCM